MIRAQLQERKHGGTLPIRRDAAPVMRVRLRRSEIVLLHSLARLVQILLRARRRSDVLRAVLLTDVGSESVVTHALGWILPQPVNSGRMHRLRTSRDHLNGAIAAG